MRKSQLHGVQSMAQTDPSPSSVILPLFIEPPSSTFDNFRYYQDRTCIFAANYVIAYSEVTNIHINKQVVF